MCCKAYEDPSARRSPLSYTSGGGLPGNSKRNVIKYGNCERRLRREMLSRAGHCFQMLCATGIFRMASWFENRCHLVAKNCHYRAILVCMRLHKALIKLELGGWAGRISYNGYDLVVSGLVLNANSLSI